MIISSFCRAMHGCHLLGNKPKQLLFIGSVTQKVCPLSWQLVFTFHFSLDPFPSFSLVDSLMLLGMYLSHTISTRVVVLICVGERFYQRIHQTSQH